MTTPTKYKKYMVLTNVFMKLSGIDPCGKVGMHSNIFLVCSKLEAMAFYAVHWACENDIKAGV